MHNADNPVVGSWSSPDAVGEKRRLAMREQDPQAGGVSQRAVLPNAATSEEDIRNARTRVEGRAEDFGPVAYVSGNNEGLLPPDYRQATEPFRTVKR